MVFVDGNLEHTTSGMLRGDRLRAFLGCWGFTDNEAQPDDADRTDDDFDPWSNPRRWERCPIRDRIDNAKDRFAWWLLGKWVGFVGAGSPRLLAVALQRRRQRRGSDGRFAPVVACAGIMPIVGDGIVPPSVRRRSFPDGQATRSLRESVGPEWTKTAPSHLRWLSGGHFTKFA